MPEPLDYLAQNEAVSQWSQRTLQDIKSRYKDLIFSTNNQGYKSLKVRTGKINGQIERISFGFNRYLVFVHKGVGRGRPIGSSKVRPKPWLNPVLDNDVPKLADVVANFKAEQAVRAIQI